MALHDILTVIALAIVAMLPVMVITSLIMGFKDNADYKKWVEENEIL